eukprot:7582887-Pyramimonas_sp.AAC.1
MVPLDNAMRKSDGGLLLEPPRPEPGTPKRLIPKCCSCKPSLHHQSSRPRPPPPVPSFHLTPPASSSTCRLARQTHRSSLTCPLLAALPSLGTSRAPQTRLARVSTGPLRGRR